MCFSFCQTEMENREPGMEDDEPGKFQSFPFER